MGVGQTLGVEILGLSADGIPGESLFVRHVEIGEG
jgi:hypothetical protein